MMKNRRSIGDKWAKHEWMRRDAALAAYLPETRRMTRKSLKALLDKHRMVYVKPVRGSQGVGVMKIGRLGRGFRLWRGTAVRTFDAYGAGYGALADIVHGKPYLVQQGIRMARFRGRPFDIRVMVQRMPGKPWKVTGIAARLAHPRKIVTNGSQGGSIYPVGELLTSGRAAKLRLMRRIGLLSARRLETYNDKLMEVGVDLAFDGRGRPWIFEANALPDPCPFTKLPDRSMLREILRYGKAIGRKYDLHCVRAKKGR